MKLESTFIFLSVISVQLSAVALTLIKGSNEPTLVDFLFPREYLINHIGVIGNIGIGLFAVSYIVNAVYSQIKIEEIKGKKITYKDAFSKCLVDAFAAVKSCFMEIQNNMYK